jgi:hypothetical protein
MASPAALRRSAGTFPPIRTSVAILLVLSGTARAQTEPQQAQQPQASASQEDRESEAADLAKKLSNPIASLISVPFQANYDCCLARTDASRWLTNIQPVIPLSISDSWNLITRTILPVISEQPSPIHPESGFGIGDTLQSFFFSPKAPTSGGLIWGAGPALLYPTGTNGFSANQWAGGPTAVALKQEGPWSVGALVNQIWSFGNGDHFNRVNQLFVQPFLTYTTKTAFTISLNTETTRDWTNNTWTVPINLGFSQVFKVDDQPLSFQMGARYYASTPHDGPRWGARFNVTFLFPH